MSSALTGRGLQTGRWCGHRWHTLTHTSVHSCIHTHTHREIYMEVRSKDPVNLKLVLLFSLPVVSCVGPCFNVSFWRGSAYSSRDSVLTLYGILSKDPD